MDFTAPSADFRSMAISRSYATKDASTHSGRPLRNFEPSTLRCQAEVCRGLHTSVVCPKSIPRKPLLMQFMAINGPPDPGSQFTAAPGHPGSQPSELWPGRRFDLVRMDASIREVDDIEEHSSRPQSLPFQTSRPVRGNCGSNQIRPCQLPLTSQPYPRFRMKELHLSFLSKCSAQEMSPSTFLPSIIWTLHINVHLVQLTFSVFSTRL